MKSATFMTKIPKAGRYEIRVAYTANANRASNVPVTIESKAGRKKVELNQREAPKHTGFQTVATIDVAADEMVSVVISNAETNGHVIVDAVQWLPAKSE